MEELRNALNELYAEFGQEKTHEKILLKLSQILDTHMAAEQRKRYEEMRCANE